MKTNRKALEDVGLTNEQVEVLKDLVGVIDKEELKQAVIDMMDENAREMSNDTKPE
jgi:hypothetical protein